MKEIGPETNADLIRSYGAILAEIDDDHDFSCEHCGGLVRERRVQREALRHKESFVILEDVPVGVCEQCGARYFDASVLRRVAEIGRGKGPSRRTVEIPVDRYAPV